MATLYPNGYSGSPQGMGQLLELHQVAQRKTVQRLHPEFRRRVFAFMQAAAAANVPLGIGTGWRVQPPKGGTFVSPGNSYHEGFMPDGRSRPNGRDDVNAMACDMVPEPSFRGDWYKANISRFGMKHLCHYKSECWHIQPVEIPTSRNFATKQPALLTWDLPGQEPNLPVYNPWKDQWGLFPVNANKAALVEGTGYTQGTQFLQSTVTYFNHVVVFKARQVIAEPFLVFGVSSVIAVRNINARFNIDGRNKDLAVEAFQGFCGYETWKIIDALATNRLTW